MLNLFATGATATSVGQSSNGKPRKVDQEIRDEWTLSIPENVLFQQLDHQGGEVVLLDVQSGGYFGLNEVGGSIWLLIQEQENVGAIIKVLAEQYDASEDRLRSDVVQFLSELRSRGLVEIHENTAG